ncbi:hypothetical protein Tco_1014258 [Tanacetum coccineum]
MSVYLAELLKKKKQVGTASSSGIFTIELFSFPNKSWVYDTGCGTHICITKQGLRGARKLEQRALYLYMGNGVRAQSKQFTLANSIPLNFYNTPNSAKGFASSESESSSSESGKRTIINLDNYNEEEVQANKGNKIVKVKTEPTD